MARFATNRIRRYDGHTRRVRHGSFALVIASQTSALASSNQCNHPGEVNAELVDRYAKVDLRSPSYQ